MKNNIKFLFLFSLVPFIVYSCKDRNKASVKNVRQKVENSDSTIYGVCGAGSSMHTLELLTDQGDTTRFLVNLEETSDVKGGMLEGDRMAVIPGVDANSEKIAKLAINLTTLLGTWQSPDKQFELLEGGKVKILGSNDAENWYSWKICNGHLILNKDTFDIYSLGADSLYLENKVGIFGYERKM